MPVLQESRSARIVGANATAISCPEEASTGATFDQATGLQLRDVLLRFPCASLEGVACSSVCRAFRERYPPAPALRDGASLAAALQQGAFAAELGDVAYYCAEGGQTGVLRLVDAAALRPGSDGQLACWPLLLQRLGELVRRHGNAVPVSSFGSSVSLALQMRCGSEVVGEEVMCVLLSQLKPLLRKHWDPTFEERTIGYYGESGNHCSFKKIKHLLAELLKWRARRQELALASEVDAVLEASAPLALAVSATHNDMVLCCPPLNDTEGQGPSAPLPRPPQVAPKMVPGRHNGSLRTLPLSGPPQRPPQAPPPQGLPLTAPPPAPPCASDAFGAGSSPKVPVGSPAAKPAVPAVQHRMAAEDRIAGELDGQKLRIENAELKKRLKFGADFLHKEIRRLRIENAELKKRLYLSSSQAQGSGDQMLSPLVQPVWLAPLVAAAVPGTAPGSSPAAASDSPEGNQSFAATPPGQQQGSGMSSPVPQGYCYAAVPVTTGLLSAGQPWGSPMAQFMAMPVGGTWVGGPDGTSAIMSPHSDMAQYLPRSLLSCSEASSSQTGSTSRDSLGAAERAKLGQANAPKMADVPAMQMQGSADRWLCIPSGIVQRQKEKLLVHSETHHVPQHAMNFGLSSDSESQGSPVAGLGTAAPATEEDSRSRAQSM